MSANRLLFEIIRGNWFLDTSNIYSYAPLLQTYLEGKQVFQKPKVEAVNKILSQSGQSIDPKSNYQDAYAFVSMTGVLTRYGDICTYGTEDYMSMLTDIEENKNIKGTVLFLDGPGGSTDAMIPVSTFAKMKKKPVVALIGTAASATYWSALEVSDHQIAEHPALSAIGSVGVMSTFVDYKEYYEKAGIKIHEIYAPESNHKNEAFKLAMEGKYDMIKEEFLSPLAKAFQAVVKRNRPNLKEETGVLTGKMFSAEKAVKLGMIDNIGNVHDAIRMIDILHEINT